MESSGQFFDHLYVHQWDVAQPAGLLLIAHGMAEHGARYAQFAKHLNEQQWSVWAIDHRGHGKTGERANKFGYLAPENGWDLIADDLVNTASKFKAKHPDAPLVLLGHSAGSILSFYATLFKDIPIQGLILSAFAPHPGILLPVGIGVAKTMSMLSGKDKPGKLMNALTFSDFNKPFKPARTDFDWLSTDREQVDRYVADPWCGFVCCNGFFVDMLTGLSRVHSSMNRLPKGLPVLMLAGADDPVVGFRKGAEKVMNKVKAVNEDTEFKIFDGMRHEIMNETQRELVYKDICTWIQKETKR